MEYNDLIEYAPVIFTSLTTAAIITFPLISYFNHRQLYQEKSRHSNRQGLLLKLNPSLLGTQSRKYQLKN
jgi:hypothetical protein